MNEKVSIIVPIYNAENYIEKCLNSLINQTYSNIEIIAINDESTDNTFSILKNYAEKDNRIILINKENTGVSDTRNIGINRAVGEYIIFVDGDDWLELDAVENMYNCSKENKCNIIRAKYVKEFNNRTEMYSEKFEYNTNLIDRIEVIDALLTGKMNGYVCLLFIRKNIIKNKIYFDTNLSMMEDELFYLDILLANNNIYFYDKVTYHYLYNKNSASRNYKNMKRNFQDSIKLNRIIEQKLEDANLFTSERKKMLDTSTSKFISETIYTLYKKDRRTMNELYNEIVSQENIMNILKNANLQDINTQNVCIIKNLINKNKILLKLFLAIRTILANLKTLLGVRK